MANRRKRLDSSTDVQFSEVLDGQPTYKENGSSPTNKKNCNGSFTSNNTQAKGFESEFCYYKTDESSVDNTNGIKAEDEDFSHIPASIRNQFIEILHYDGGDIPQENIQLSRKLKKHFIEYLHSQYESKKLSMDDIVESQNPFIKFVSYEVITHGTELFLNQFCPGRKLFSAYK